MLFQINKVVADYSACTQLIPGTEALTSEQRSRALTSALQLVKRVEVLDDLPDSATAAAVAALGVFEDMFKLLVDKHDCTAWYSHCSQIEQYPLQCFQQSIYWTVLYYKNVESFQSALQICVNGAMVTEANRLACILRSQATLCVVGSFILEGQASNLSVLVTSKASKYSDCLPLLNNQLWWTACIAGGCLCWEEATIPAAYREAALVACEQRWKLSSSLSRFEPPVAMLSTVLTHH